MSELPLPVEWTSIGVHRGLAPAFQRPQSSEPRTGSEVSFELFRSRIKCTRHRLPNTETGSQKFSDDFILVKLSTQVRYGYNISRRSAGLVRHHQLEGIDSGTHCELHGGTVACGVEDRGSAVQ